MFWQIHWPRKKLNGIRPWISEKPFSWTLAVLEQQHFLPESFIWEWKFSSWINEFSFGCAFAQNMKGPSFVIKYCIYYPVPLLQWFYCSSAPLVLNISYKIWTQTWQTHFLVSINWRSLLVLFICWLLLIFSVTRCWIFWKNSAESVIHVSYPGKQ